MSVLVKGMEMPKAGNWKTIRIYNDGTCAEPNWQGDCKYMQGCEAIPIPPHGDLIGREWLIDIALHLMNTAKNDDIYNGVKWMLQYIIDAPTIIPAEGGE